MEHFFAQWDRFKKDFQNNSLFIFFDYDGTLTPIVATPALAATSLETAQLLKELSALTSVRVAIISGRSLEDLKSKGKVGNIIYSGNHGFEIENEKPDFGALNDGKFQKILEELGIQLLNGLGNIGGIIIENKGWSMSIHYRLMEESHENHFYQLVQGICEPYLAKNQIKLGSGKKLWEIRPPIDWNKGKAAVWLWKKYESSTGKKFLPIYLGDDQTDEDAFRELQGHGISIRIGQSEKSAAPYYLENTDETMEFIRRILALKSRST